MERLKNYEQEQQQPSRYVITKTWYSKWLNFLNQLRDSRQQSLEREEELLRRAFHSDGEQFIETYIKGGKSVPNFPHEKRQDVIDLVTAPMWYFFYFLYADPGESKPPPCIMLSPEIPNHVKDREQNRSVDASMSTSSRRDGKQNIVINQNHIYIQQLNVQKNSRSPVSQVEDDNDSRRTRAGHHYKNNSGMMSTTSAQSKRRPKDLKDGIVGLKNNSLYCYMNACLQCLLPIDELRDYYINEEFKRFHETKTVSNSNEYSRKVAEFFRDAFEYDAR